MLCETAANRMESSKTSRMVKNKRDQRFVDFCKELGAYVDEHHHFPKKHTALLNSVKYIRRKMNQGNLEEWKKQMFLEIAMKRDMETHTGGYRKKTDIVE